MVLSLYLLDFITINELKSYIMKAVLLAIKPEYVKKILQGTKKFEYRKRLAKEDVSVIYIYSTSPYMKVVASVQIIGRLSASPTSLWEKTKEKAGISRSKYREYFHGCKIAYAYELGEVSVFPKEKELREYGVSTPPQSFVYININRSITKDTTRKTNKRP